MKRDARWSQPDPERPNGSRGEMSQKWGGKMATTSPVLVRIVYRFLALQTKNLSPLSRRRDGCMIASVLEVKKEIPVNRRWVCFDSLPARDRGIWVVMQSSGICQEQ